MRLAFGMMVYGAALAHAASDGATQRFFDGVAAALPNRIQNLSLHSRAQLPRVEFQIPSVTSFYTADGSPAEAVIAVALLEPTDAIALWEPSNRDDRLDSLSVLVDEHGKEVLAGGQKLYAACGPAPDTAVQEKCGQNQVYVFPGRPEVSLTVMVTVLDADLSAIEVARMIDYEALIAAAEPER